MEENRFCCVGKPATPQRQPILHFALAEAGELHSSMMQASHEDHSPLRRREIVRAAIRPASIRDRGDETVPSV